MHLGPVLPISNQVFLLMKLFLQLGQFLIVELFVVLDLPFAGDLGQFLEVVAVELNLDLIISDGCL